MTAPRIKICGISTPEDACFAESLGVDAIGLVFHEKSPRNVSVEQAGEILAALGGFVSVVALFHNAQAGKVADILALYPQLIPQFHGDESVAYCEQFARPYLKAFGMGGDAPQLSQINAHRRASAVLLDANAHGQEGGTGDVFDWSRVPQGIERPLILAGGLTPDNVAAAVRALPLYAVDVSSGVESARGVKDHGLMKKFVENTRGASREVF
ncbi:phosphoribosylanthranilate isomerase [Granulosicoccaceae sp. 1_MG-2023]|nr:phosphoribosylanthranilate isomerase [Granulosicoccaceae sp. 1_MG-2023]